MYGSTTHPGPDSAIVTIDRTLCSDCGACEKVCVGKPIEWIDGNVGIDPERMFGCMGCGACMAVCPTGAVSVSGRDMSAADVFDLSPDPAGVTYEQLMALLERRRSCRDFTSQDVDPELVDKILAAVATSPVGIPPSEVGVLVLHGRERVGAYVSDTLDWMRRTNPLLKRMLPFMRLFTPHDYEMTRDFVVPAFESCQEKGSQGVDRVAYDAPLVMVFYSTGVGVPDPADPIIPATLAVVAAQSLGLGSCMLRWASLGVEQDKGIRKKWGLPERVKPGVAVAIGHPATPPVRGVRRRLAAVVRA